MKPGRIPSVRRLPAILDEPNSAEFFRDVAPLLKVDRSQFVFDLSEVRQLHAAGINMLLACMEEALKENGDLKLAAIPAESAVILELTGIDSVFEIFDTTESAVQSFQQLPSLVFEKIEMQL